MTKFQRNGLAIASAAFASVAIGTAVATFGSVYSFEDGVIDINARRALMVGVVVTVLSSIGMTTSGRYAYLAHSEIRRNSMSGPR